MKCFECKDCRLNFCRTLFSPLVYTFFLLVVEETVCVCVCERDVLLKKSGGMSGLPPQTVSVS